MKTRGLSQLIDKCLDQHVAVAACFNRSCVSFMPRIHTVYYITKHGFDLAKSISSLGAYPLRLMYSDVAVDCLNIRNTILKSLRNRFSQHFKLQDFKCLIQTSGWHSKTCFDSYYIDINYFLNIRNMFSQLSGSFVGGVSPKPLKRS